MEALAFFYRTKCLVESFFSRFHSHKYNVMVVLRSASTKGTHTHTLSAIVPRERDSVTGEAYP